MNDNKTSQAAIDYDANINKTIPRYQLFHDEAINLIKIINPHPGSWLDTGCGTGTLILKAAEHFKDTGFVAADPSEGMLAIAKEKLADLGVTYLLAGSEQLCYKESFDVVTAVLAHHYLDYETRLQATQNCFNALKKGGIYLTFETIKPTSEVGTQIGLRRWREAQIASSKSPETVDKHISRYGTELQPILIEAHISLMKAAGFSTVELFWISGLQAGFYGIK